MKTKFVTTWGKGMYPKVLITMLVLFLLPLVGSIQAGTYYVDKDCVHGCSLYNGLCSDSDYAGTSWDRAWCTIGQALRIAEEGSTIYVAPSEYNENLSISKTGIKLISRDSEDNENPENTIIFGSCNGPEDFRGVVVRLYPYVNVEIHGFTITMRPSDHFFPPYCSAAGCWNGAVGGCWDGIGCQGSPLDHAACCWQWFPPGRAGIHVWEGSSLTLDNCAIKDNWGTRAGGIFCDGCTLTVRNSTIKGNHAGSYGAGAIAMRNGALTLINSVISDNGGCGGPGIVGGGIAATYNTDFFQPQVDKNSITVVNSTIANNNGGISLAYTDSLTTENSIIWWNGTGALCRGSNLMIYDETYNDTNCPENSYLYMGGHPVMPPQYYEFNMNYPNRFYINITNSDIQTTNYIDYRLFRTQDATNINLDPEFIDKDNGDYRLDRSSPCIDIGNNNAPGLPDNDLDGQTRITDGDGNGIPVVDMGAYEALAFDPNSLVANFEVDPPAGTLKYKNPFVRAEGVDPLTVDFTDTSPDPTHSICESPTHSCRWNFGDCGECNCEVDPIEEDCVDTCDICTSDDCCPSHEYWVPVDDQFSIGIKDYAVSLTVSDGVNSDTRTVNYAVHVTDLPVVNQIEQIGNEIVISGYDFEDVISTQFGEKAYHPGDQTHLCDLYSFYDSVTNSPCSSPAQRSVTIGDITYPLDPDDPYSPINGWQNNGIYVKKACSWFGCETSVTKDVSIIVNKYYESNTVTSSLDRTGCIPDIPCTLVPDNPVVHQGGTLGIQATVTNNDCLSQTFSFATYAITPGGNRYPASGWLYGPVSVTLGGGASQSGHISHNIPSTAALGTYTYHGNVGVQPNTLYNKCQFDFTVIP